MMTTTWYFEVAAEAGLATNLETGDNDPAYIQYSMDHKVPITPEKYDEMTPVIAAALADMAKVPAEYFAPISEAEYLDHVGDEGGYTDDDA